MTLTSFEKAINTGFGSAIIELIECNGDVERYRNAVLFACTNSTTYDSQLECNRAEYLYEAVSFFNDREFFEQKITEALFDTHDLFLVNQLAELLRLFYNDGSKTALSSLEKRLCEYFAYLPTISEYTFKENPRECMEVISRVLCDIHGEDYFYKIIERMGDILAECPSDKPTYILFYDEILYLYAADKFGGKDAVIQKLEKLSETSKGIAAFVENMKNDELIQKENQKKRVIEQNKQIGQTSPRPKPKRLSEMTDLEKRQRIFDNGFDFHYNLTYKVTQMFESRKATERDLNALLYLYHRNICSECRKRLVKIMCEAEILPENIRRECMYDCVPETREAVRL